MKVGDYISTIYGVGKIIEFDGTWITMSRGNSSANSLLFERYIHCSFCTAIDIEEYIEKLLAE